MSENNTTVNTDLVVSFVEINDAQYIGTLDRNNRQFIGIPVDGRSGQSLFAAYLEKAAIGDLVTIDIGEGRDLVSTKLTDQEVITYDMVTAMWKVAEKRSQGWLVAKVFGEGLGKF